MKQRLAGGRKCIMQKNCIRIIEANYSDSYFDLYINGVFYKRALKRNELINAILLFQNNKGIITQDPVYKSDLYLWLEV